MPLRTPRHEAAYGKKFAFAFIPLCMPMLGGLFFVGTENARAAAGGSAKPAPYTFPLTNLNNRAADWHVFTGGAGVTPTGTADLTFGNGGSPLFKWGF